MKFFGNNFSEVALCVFSAVFSGVSFYGKFL